MGSKRHRCMILLQHDHSLNIRHLRSERMATHTGQSPHGIVDLAQLKFTSAAGSRMRDSCWVISVPPFRDGWYGWTDTAYHKFPGIWSRALCMILNQAAFAPARPHRLNSILRFFPTAESQFTFPSLVYGSNMGWAPSVLALLSCKGILRL